MTAQMSGFEECKCCFIT